MATHTIEEQTIRNRPSQARRRLASTAVALLVCSVPLAACSSEDAVPDPAASETTALAPDTDADAGPAGPPVSSLPRQSCAAGTLAAAVPGTATPEVIDIVCEIDAAAATLVNGPDGESVVIFSLVDGAWSLAGLTPVSADPASIAPAGFSATAIPAWARLRQARLTRAEAPPRRRGGGSEGCPIGGDVENCPPAQDPPSTGE